LGVVGRHHSEKFQRVRRRMQTLDRTREPGDGLGVRRRQAIGLGNIGA
jgi:hypothetical protein